MQNANVNGAEGGKRFSFNNLSGTMGKLMTSQSSLLEVLKEKFGYTSFRGQQLVILQHVLAGKSGLVLMPTGMGKSLCYQLPAFLADGLVLVVSPLIALAADQVAAARRLGLKAEALNSSFSPNEKESCLKKLAAEKIQLLLVTPERFRKADFMLALEKNKISLLAIDEAHCISQWGHDFRPEYARLGEVRKLLGDPPTLALTATATPQVQQEIRYQLNMTNEPTWSEGVARPNINLQVHEVVGMTEKIQRLVGELNQQTGSTIVYFSLIKQLENVAFELKRLNINYVKYHSQLGDGERHGNQKKFISGEATLMLATPAFGLGVNKADIRQIVHMEVPGSLEAYYQEAGRSGRDGKLAKAVLFYDPDDVAAQMDFIKWANPEPSFIKAVFRLLETNLPRVQQEGLDYMRSQLLFHHRSDYRLETVLNRLESWGVIDWPHRNVRELKIISEIEADYVDEDIFNQRLKMQSQKLLAMVQWAKAEVCRRKIIHEYFGAVALEWCGNCDVCEANGHGQG